MEFSKKILIWSYLIGVITILFAMIIQIVFIITNYQGDSSIVTSLLVGGFAEMSVVSTTYALKARSENQIKLKAMYKEKLTEEDFENNNY